jgi:putative copper export protein
MLLFVVRDIMRTAHVLAAGAWIGGSIVYLVVITPALRLGGASPQVAHVSARVAALFRSLVNVAVGVLLVTGVFLVADRLGVGVGVAYWIVLGAKIAVSLVMFGLALYLAQEARRPGKRRSGFARWAPQVILALGGAAFLLGTTLTLLFERG